MSASTPEELETLLEDAVLLGDHRAVEELFEPGAVIISGSHVEGPDGALAELTAAGYVASTQRVTQQRGIAVVVGECSVNISRRGPDGGWRLLATVLHSEAEVLREQPVGAQITCIVER